MPWRRGRNDETSLGIVGFGAFGRLIARHLAPYARLRAYDPAPPPAVEQPGVASADLATVAASDIVVLAVPVDRLAEAVAAIRPHLRPGALVLDVGSVKVGPAEILRRGLPEHVDIIGTHPLFGPQSARDGVHGHKIALCPVRGRAAALRLAVFLRARLGLKVILTTPEAHDREAAVAQGLTHLIAAALLRMEPLPVRMTTASFDALLRAVGMVRHDALSVFQAIGAANPYAAEARGQFLAHAAELAATLDAGMEAVRAET